MIRKRSILLMLTVQVACTDVDLDSLSDPNSALVEANAACDADGSLGAPCEVGHGVCQREGTYVCSMGEIICETPVDVPAGADELCNTDADEDCDGITDEAPDGRCCGDKDCTPGICIFRQLPGPDAGLARENLIQGGTCVRSKPGK